MKKKTKQHHSKKKPKNPGQETQRHQRHLFPELKGMKQLELKLVLLPNKRLLMLQMMLKLLKKRMMMMRELGMTGNL